MNGNPDIIRDILTKKLVSERGVLKAVAIALNTKRLRHIRWQLCEAINEELGDEAPFVLFDHGGLADVGEIASRAEE